MRSHEIDYRILGASMPMLEITLDPQETVIAEAGALTFMEEGIRFETRLGDGSDPDQGVLGKLFAAGKRWVSGESVFITHFTHEGSGRRSLGLAAPYPGMIEPINLAELGGGLICQKDAFLAAAKGTKIDITFSRRLGAGFFGGEGFILQKLSGDGLAFVHAGGTLVKRRLNNETLRVDTGCLVAFSPGLDYNIELSKGLKSMLFGGEGLFMATLEGSGEVWLQSLPFSRLADRILAHAPSMGGSKQDER